MNAVLGGSKNGGPNAFSSRQELRGDGAGVDLFANGLAKEFTQVSKISHLALVYIFTHTAREHDAVQVTKVFDGVGQIQMFKIFFGEGLVQNAHERLCHPEGHLGHVLTLHFETQVPIKTSLLGQVLTCGIESGDDVGLIHHQQSASQMNCSRGHQFPVLNEAQFGGAPTNVNVQNSLLEIVRTLGCSRAVDRQHGLHVVASGCTDKFAALLGQNFSNGFAVFTTQSLSSQNHSPSIDIIWVQASSLVGAVNDGPQCFGIHGGVAQIRRERDGGLVQGLTIHHGVARGEILCNSSQVNFGKNHLRS